MQKQRIFEQSRFYVAGPSQWILDRARESMFCPAIVEQRVIPNGVDLDIFRPAPVSPLRRRLGIPEESFVAVYTAVRAKTNPFKDYETILNALNLLAEQTGPPLAFLVLGDGGPTEHRGRLTIHHLGFLNSQQDVSEIYQAADLLLHAAHQETFGMVLAEGLACGLPVIATSVGGIPEVVADGEVGILVPPKDSVAMARAINELQQNRELTQRMNVAARARAEAKFGLNQMLESYRRWYEEVLDE